MPEKTAERNRYNWRLSLYSLLGAFVIFVPLAISGPDLGFFAYLLLVVPSASLVLFILVILKKGHRRLSLLSMLFVFWAVSAVLLANYSIVRDTTRWILGSKIYKTEVLARPRSKSGELNHMQWDSWGFAGADTSVYLVFDPNDALAAKPEENQYPGKFDGMPCGAASVHRLEKYWYSVKFYTDTDWDHCN
jgi:hypothetical protein